mgnify:FL=1
MAARKKEESGEGSVYCPEKLVVGYPYNFIMTLIIDEYKTSCGKHSKSVVGLNLEILRPFPPEFRHLDRQNSILQRRG